MVLMEYAWVEERMKGFIRDPVTLELPKRRSWIRLRGLLAKLSALKGAGHLVLIVVETSAHF